MKNVLVLGHDKGNTGGVGNFLRLFRDRCAGDVDIDLFVNGHRPGERTRLDKLKRLLGDYVRFVSTLAKTRWTLVHFNPSLDHASFLREIIFMMIASLFRQRYIVFFRGWDWTAFEKYLAGGGPVAWVCRTMVRRAACILVLSEDFRNALHGIVPDERIAVVSTMFDGAVLDRDAVKDFSTLRLLFMSRFIPAKRGDQVIRAFEQIAAAYPDAELVMAGDGPDMDHLRATQAAMTTGKDRVRFTGYVRDTEKTAVLNACNVFIFPTEHAEGLPNAMLEGMGAGMIPLVTRAGGTFEAMGDGAFGVCLPSSDVEPMVTALHEIAGDPQASRDWSKRIKAHAWENFEAGAVCRRILAIYNRTTDGAA